MDLKTKAYYAATFNAIFIGLSFLFTRISLSFAKPFTTLSFRFVISLILMLILMAPGIIKINLKKEYIRELSILSFFQPLLFFSFQAFGLEYISSSEAGVISALIPVFAGIFGIFFLKERVSIKEFGAFFLSIAGVFFIFYMKNCAIVENCGFSTTTQSASSLFLTVQSSNLIFSGSSTRGVIYTLISVMASAMYFISGRKYSKNIDPVTLTYGMMLYGAIGFSICAVLFEGMGFERIHSLLLNMEFMAGILYLAIFTSIGTSFLANYSLKYLNAAKSAVFMNLSTIIAVIAGVFVLHEEFHYYHLTGSFMIIAGIFMANHLKQIE